MAKGKRIGLIAVIVIILALAIGVFHRSKSSRFKLPAGPGTPAVTLANNYGIILAADGSLWAWGSEFPDRGVLGLGKITNQPSLRRIGSDTNWVQVAAGGYYNLALKSDGTIWAWGSNLRRQLFGNAGNLSTAALSWANTPVSAAPGHDWKKIANGGIHSLALKKDGTLWAWGLNWSGSLGIGSRTDSAVPLQVGSATNWIKIWAGGLQSIGQQSDGSLWVWGDNPAFPMGTNSLLTPTRLSPDTNWADVGLGTWSAFGLKADGTLWVWGRTAKVFEQPCDQALDAVYGRAGSNWTSHFFEHMASAAPLRVGTNADWQAIAGSGWWYVLLKKKDGSLWVLDATEYDDIGKAPSQYQPVGLRKIDAPKDIVALSAGHTISFGRTAARNRIIGVALTRDGEVWTWGTALGESRPDFWQGFLARAGRALRLKTGPIPYEPRPVYRETPWRLPQADPDAPAKDFCPFSPVPRG